MHDLAAGDISNCGFQTCSACMIWLQVTYEIVILKPVQHA